MQMCHNMTHLSPFHTTSRSYNLPCIYTNNYHVDNYFRLYIKLLMLTLSESRKLHIYIACGNCYDNSHSKFVVNMHDK